MGNFYEEVLMAFASNMRWIMVVIILLFFFAQGTLCADSNSKIVSSERIYTTRRVIGELGLAAMGFSGILSFVLRKLVWPECRPKAYVWTAVLSAGAVYLVAKNDPERPFRWYWGIPTIVLASMVGSVEAFL